MRRTFLSFAVLVCGFVPAVAFAQQATVNVEQILPNEKSSDHSTWVLILQDGSSYPSANYSDKKNASITVHQLGQATLSVTPAAGASASISVYRNGTLEKTEDVQQVAFTLSDKDTMRLVVRYAYNKFGLIGVTSKPSGLPFLMLGPGNQKYTAVSPKSFSNIPIGTYSVKFGDTPDCYASPAKSVVLGQNKRVAVYIELPCTKGLAKRESRKPTDKRPTQRAIRRQLELQQHQAARDKLSRQY